jgi:hypothetical protein
MHGNLCDKVKDLASCGNQGTLACNCEPNPCGLSCDIRGADIVLLQNILRKSCSDSAAEHYRMALEASFDMRFKSSEVR